MLARKERPPYGPNDVIGGKYLLRRPLGEGGMAVVYAAKDLSCDRQVAVKIWRPGLASRRPLSSAQVEREAATAVMLHERTPHVVEVLTAGVTDDEHRLPYYVMERLRGRTLREGIAERRLRAQPLEIVEVAGLVIEIATALAYAHEMGVVHRDVKPENIYMAEQRDGSYIAKLLDFGISALVVEGAEPTHRRSFSGSRPYASPEQLDGRPPAPACDVYALGLVLFEMLTFTLPHDRHNLSLSVHETALNVLRHPLPALRSFRDDVPPRFEHLIRSCLAHDPAHRPDVLRMANALREIKRLFEARLLGSDIHAITDVTGPPVAVLLHQLENNSQDIPVSELQRIVGSTPIAADATTEPPPNERPTDAVSYDGEIFFMNPVTPRDTEAVEQLAPLPHANEPPQYVVTERMGLPVPSANPAPPEGQPEPVASRATRADDGEQPSSSRASKRPGDTVYVNIAYEDTDGGRLGGARWPSVRPAAGQPSCDSIPGDPALVLSDPGGFFERGSVEPTVASEPAHVPPRARTTYVSRGRLLAISALVVLVGLVGGIGVGEISKRWSMATDHASVEAPPAPGAPTVAPETADSALTAVAPRALSMTSADASPRTTLRAATGEAALAATPSPEASTTPTRSPSPRRTAPVGASKVTRPDPELELLH